MGVKEDNQVGTASPLCQWETEHRLSGCRTKPSPLITSRASLPAHFTFSAAYSPISL